MVNEQREKYTAEKIEAGKVETKTVNAEQAYTAGRSGKVFVYQLNTGDYVAVDDDGAVAGPSGSPDAVIQTALDNVDDGRGIVHAIGSGYAVQNTVEITNKASLFGETAGRGSFGAGTRLYKDGASGAVLQVGESGSQTYGNEIKEVMVGGGPIEWYSARGSMDTVWSINSDADGLRVLEVSDANHENRFRDVEIQSATDDGIVSKAADQHFSDCVIRQSGGRGLVLVDGGNLVTNTHIWGSASAALEIPSRQNVISAKIFDNEAEGILIPSGANENTIFALVGKASTATSNPLVNLSGDRNYISGVFIGTGNESQAFNIFGNDNVINAQIAGSFNSSPVSDNGNRNIINGRSFTSSASPGSGSSVWDGNETRAYNHDVTVEDRSVSAPYPQYKADSAGNWVQVA